MTKQLFITLLTILFITVGFGANATTYYVSSLSGNDFNAGTTTSFPWQSINRVNSTTFNPGDSILFKRNEVWRGQLIPSSGNNLANVYYGAYSVGDNPILLGSQDYSTTNDWLNLGGNLWECSSTFTTDIGNIIFDNAASVGFKKWNLSELQIQDDFMYNLLTGKVVIYSTSNPATIHTEIELALREHIINQQNTSFITFENLSLKYGGAHGFGGGNTANLTITSCELSYIGGGDLNMDGTTRFGNGIEFWGNASNNTVEKCRIWEIYDTGLTNQNHTTAANQENIRYQNNSIWNCGLASFEYWNRPATSTTSDIFFENNTCLYAGEGWGSQRPDYHGIHVLIDNNPAQTDTIYIRNNIFYNAKRSTYAVEDNINGVINLDYNLINQATGIDTVFVSFPSFTLFTFGSFSNYTATTGKDLNSITGDPLFVSLPSINLHLTVSSPCINNGTNVNIVDDFDGNGRPLSGGYDIGSYEYPGSLGIDSIENPSVLSIFPNPAQNHLQIAFTAENTSELELCLFDSRGQLLHSLNNYKSLDEIDVSHLPVGIYYFALKSKTGDVLKGQIQILK